MNKVSGNAAGNSINCSFCEKPTEKNGEHDRRPVKTSCPDGHVFHLGCITQQLDKQHETGLDKRTCSKCKKPALPLIRKDQESRGKDESPYCESRMLNACRSGNLEMLEFYLDKDKLSTKKDTKTLVNQPHCSALTGHHEYLLTAALKHKHTDLAQALINQDANVNVTNHQGETPLQIADRLGITECFEKLMEVKAKIDDALCTDNPEDLKILIGAGTNINDVLRTVIQKGKDSLFKDLIGTKLLSPSNLNTALCEAAGQGKKNYLKPLINKGADDFKSALRKAAEEGKEECLEILISQQATDLNDALCAAVEKGQEKCIKLLIKKGKKDELNLDNALYRAIVSGKDKSRDILDKKGANITNVVHTAASKGDCEFFDLLANLDKYKSEIDATDEEGQTPLHITAANRHEACLKKLIDKGAKVNATNNNGETPLHIATKISLTEGRKQEGIDINATVINDKTFEHYTITIEKENDTGCMSELTKKKINFNARDKDGITPLMIATLWGKSDKLALLLLKGADIHTAANCGTTALHLAACWGRTDCLAKLLEEGAEVNVKDKDGATPLHMAALNGHLKSAQALLNKCPTSVNEIMNDGCRPLHLAARNGHTKIVHEFINSIEAEVDPKFKNKKGDTALHEAAREGHTETLTALLENDRSLAKKKNNDDETALHVAARKGHTKAFEELLKFDLNTALDVNKDGDMALHLAACEGHTGIVDALLTSFGKEARLLKLMVTEPNKDGMTALDLANNNSHTKCQELLKEKGAKCNPDRHLAAPNDVTDTDNAKVFSDSGRSQRLKDFNSAASTGNTRLNRGLLRFDSSQAKEKDAMGMTAFHKAALNDVTDTDNAKVVSGSDRSQRLKDFNSAVSTGNTEKIKELLSSDASLAREKGSITGMTALHKAAENGRTEVIETLLGFKYRDKDLAKDLAKEKDCSGITALHLAAENGHAEVIQLLLRFDQSLAEEESKYGITALHEAAENGHEQIVQILLGFDQSLAEKKSFSGMTALHKAAYKGHKKVIKTLLRFKYLDKDLAKDLAREKDIMGRTALHWAVKDGHKEAVKEFLDFDPSLAKERDKDGMTALDLAINNGHAACQRLLSKNGAHQ